MKILLLATVMPWTEYFQVWLPIAVIVFLYLLLAMKNKLPNTKAISEFMSVLNTRGGNIFVLALASAYFFRYSMYMFNMLLGMVRDKTISEDNAFALMAIQFVTTTAFGGAMGALLKTMTGESSIPPAPQNSEPKNPEPKKPEPEPVQTVPDTH